MAAQVFVHCGGDAEPFCEAGDGLVQEHAQALHGADLAGAGAGQQGRFQRDVDDVGDRQAAWGAVQVDVQWRIAGHTQGGGVDQQGVVGDGVVSGFPVDEAEAGEFPG